MRLLDEKIIAAFPAAPTAVRVRDLVVRLGLPRGEQSVVRDAVKRMVKEGRVIRLGARRYALNSSDAVRIGTLTLTRRGFGFVVTEDEHEDVYVRASSVGHAMHRDRVRVDVFEGRRGKKEGRIIDILERGTHTFVGVIHQAGKAQWLVPRDDRLPDRIRVDGDGACHGDLVAAEFVMWPGRGGQTATARVLRSFATEGEAARETDMAVYDMGLPVRFSEETTAETAAFDDALDEDEIKRRLDLRQRPLITVDPQSARDYDDAVHACSRSDGGWTLTVAIADVAHYVASGTSLDSDARQRSFSAYFPDRVIPMLPDRLSGDLCSLRPHVDRYSMAVEMDVSVDGELEDIRVHEAVINSHARLNYDRAAYLLGVHPDASSPSSPASDEEQSILPVLKSVLDVTRVLRRRRSKRGYLSLEIGEPSIVLGSDGLIEDVQTKIRHEAHLMIEEAMLAANEAIARRLDSECNGGLFRIHSSPPEGSLERFRIQASALGFDVAPLEGAGALTRLLATYQNEPKVWLLSIFLLRAMARAEYRAEVAPHFGLGLDTYLHFTSPIRRYPDLVVHRIVKDFLVSRETELPDDLPEIARHVSRRERLVLDAERDVTAVYKVLYMRDRIGETMTATVTAVTANGVFVQFAESACDGFVPVESIKSDWFEANENYTQLVGERTGRTITLGDELDVTIKSVSVRRRQITAYLNENSKSTSG